MATTISALRTRVEATGKPGVIAGLGGACRDCTAYGQLTLLPGNRMTEQVFHDEGCPVLTGAVKWEPVAL